MTRRVIRKKSSQVFYADLTRVRVISQNNKNDSSQFQAIKKCESSP